MGALTIENLKHLNAPSISVSVSSSSSCIESVSSSLSSSSCPISESESDSAESELITMKKSVCRKLLMQKLKRQSIEEYKVKEDIGEYKVNENETRNVWRNNLRKIHLHESKNEIMK